MSKLEEKFLEKVREAGLPEPQPEYHFHQPKDGEKQRKWRFDFAYPAQRIAIEVEGAVYSQGRHTRGSGYSKDCEKYNTATIQGWKVLRFTGGMLKDAITTIRQLMEEYNITAEDLWRSNGA